ncbi:DUF4328 domain-containing protein [Mycobacterium sp. CVI_P3]|uniref:DUF4328 domain-containing protein n=1 Tax=Mycobacterium pinniadriaticum TaxID=2994102 RepID=A0ABT3SK29_9MYCO|nr:DUF4328 domain-containing protein [Mycobacterium pinniadriaticum]MCX2933474.1 DUF4328 domain-containing protein [Mycobacterium pinniadriaticum]MCX2939887.1 DUF4328 domain-containing protein [Mycobacterium pinniadriaticum]
MIQVCSQCGTRWNVRDRQRVWCPRCHGALMAPTNPPDARWGPAATSHPPTRPAGPQGGGPRLPSGFRWIAVRPGPPPPPRRRRRHLGPTPRYTYIPRWGLADHVAPPAPSEDATVKKGPAPVTVRAAMLSAVTIFGLAAAIHIVRYVLLLINRTSLLPPLVAGAALLLGVLVSLAAIVAVILTAVVTTSWLIARRTAVYQHLGQEDPRPAWALWAGCLVPIVNLVWAPVYVIELAHAEQTQSRLRGPITAWWMAWILSTAVSLFAIATSFTTKPQGIADNTVTVIVAYLLGAAVLVLLWQVFDAFVRKPVERPLHRWVMLGVGQSEPAKSDSPSAVEPDQQEPAA